MTHIHIYDTTLRDGSQGEGVSFSMEDRAQHHATARRDRRPLHRGRLAGSNDKDRDFFRAVRDVPLGQAQIAAFGSNTARGRTVRGRYSDRSVAGSRDAGRHHRRQELGSARASRVGDHARREPGDDRPRASAICESRAAASFTTPSTSSTATKPTGSRVGDHRRGRGRGCGVRHPVRDERRHAAVGGGGDRPQAGAYLSEHRPSARSWRRCRSGFTRTMTAASAPRTRCRGAAGATQVQGTVNGYGERVGNCNLCTVIPDLQLKMGYRCLDEAGLAAVGPSSRHFVDETANMAPNPRLPFVGSSAFAHKGGIHVAAMLKVEASYQHIDPSLVGNRKRVLVSELFRTREPAVQSARIRSGHDPRGRAGCVGAG